MIRSMEPSATSERMNSSESARCILPCFVVK